MNSQTKATHLAQALARSFRPRTALFSWVIYSAVIVIHNGLDALLLALGLVLFVALYGIVALQNDLSDIETDKINHRQDIPYSMGLLTEAQLIKAMLVLSVVVTITGLLLNQLVLLWISLYIFLGYVYSGPLNVKSRGIFAALLLGFCYGALPWLIAASVTSQLGEGIIIFLAFASFIFSSGIIVLKDFRDIKGDRATHKKTLLVIKGNAWIRKYYLFVTSLAYVLLLTYSYLISKNLGLLLFGTIVGLLNYWLLAANSISSQAIVRSTRGRLARILFFGYALMVYFIIVNIV